MRENVFFLNTSFDTSSPTLSPKKIVTIIHFIHILYIYCLSFYTHNTNIYFQMYLAYFYLLQISRLFKLILKNDDSFPILSWLKIAEESLGINGSLFLSPRHVLIRQMRNIVIARAHIDRTLSGYLGETARRRWERMPANGQKRPSRGWSCRSSNRPREIDHLALLLHPLHPLLFLRIPPSCEIPSPPLPSCRRSSLRFHYPPSCSLYYRTAAQASPYIVNMSGTSKRNPAHTRTRTHTYSRPPIRGRAYDCVR